MYYSTIEISWWVWVSIGFGIGVYAHIQHVRHWLNWLMIKILSGFIWLLQKTDNLYDEEFDDSPDLPTETPTKPLATNHKNQVELNSMDELQTLLKNNPHLTISRRQPQ